MPTYQFQCDKCRKRFSVIRPISASSRAAACPSCKSKNVRQVLGAFYAKTVKKS